MVPSEKELRLALGFNLSRLTGSRDFLTVSNKQDSLISTFLTKIKEEIAVSLNIQELIALLEALEDNDSNAYIVTRVLSNKVNCLCQENLPNALETMALLFMETKELGKFKASAFFFKKIERVLNKMTLDENLDILTKFRKNITITNACTYQVTTKLHTDLTVKMVNKLLGLKNETITNAVKEKLKLQKA